MKEKILKSLKENLPLILVIGVIMIFYAIVGCPFRFFFGVCCPGCGITRACLSILRLDFAAAFRYNPLVYILPIALLIFIMHRKIPKTTQNLLLGIGICLFLGVYLYRLLTGNEYVYIDLNRGLVFQILKEILEKIK